MRPSRVAHAWPASRDIPERVNIGSLHVRHLVYQACLGCVSRVLHIWLSGVLEGALHAIQSPRMYVQRCAPAFPTTSSLATTPGTKGHSSAYFHGKPMRYFSSLRVPHRTVSHYNNSRLEVVPTPSRSISCRCRISDQERRRGNAHSLHYRCH